MPRFLFPVTASLAAAAALTAGASAQDYYLSGSAGFNFQNDSDNSGALTRDFITGDGMSIAPGTVWPSGSSVDWSTEFDSGVFLAGAFGYSYHSNWRGEIEVSYSEADVDTHTGVNVGGSSIGSADAAVLVTGATPLGMTVADLVADGQGDITTWALSVNGYYDFPIQNSTFDVYVGAGIGLAEVKVEYSPSGIGIIDDSEMGTLFQAMFGASYEINDNMDLFGGYRYRTTGDVETNSILFPTSLDIENDSHILEFGIRLTQ